MSESANDKYSAFRPVQFLAVGSGKPVRRQKYSDADLPVDLFEQVPANDFLEVLIVHEARGDPFVLVHAVKE